MIETNNPYHQHSILIHLLKVGVQVVPGHKHELKTCNEVCERVSLIFRLSINYTTFRFPIFKYFTGPTGIRSLRQNLHIWIFLIHKHYKSIRVCYSAFYARHFDVVLKISSRIRRQNRNLIECHYFTLIFGVQVYDFIETELHDLKEKWAKGIQYEMSVYCPGCKENQDAPTKLPLIPMHLNQCKSGFVNCERCGKQIPVSECKKLILPEIDG